MQRPASAISHERLTCDEVEVSFVAKMRDLLYRPRRCVSVVPAAATFEVAGIIYATETYERTYNQPRQNISFPCKFHLPQRLLQQPCRKPTRGGQRVTNVTPSDDPRVQQRLCLHAMLPPGPCITELSHEVLVRSRNKAHATSFVCLSRSHIVKDTEHRQVVDAIFKGPLLTPPNIRNLEALQAAFRKPPSLPHERRLPRREHILLPHMMREARG